MADGGGGDYGAEASEIDNMGAPEVAAGQIGADNDTMGVDEAQYHLGPATKTWYDFLGNIHPNPMNNVIALHWKYTDIDAMSIGLAAEMSSEMRTRIFTPYYNGIAQKYQLRGMVIVNPFVNHNQITSYFADGNEAPVQLNDTTKRGRFEIYLRTIVKNILIHRHSTRRWPGTIDLPPLMEPNALGVLEDSTPHMWCPGPLDPASGQPTPSALQAIEIRNEGFGILAHYEPYKPVFTEEKYALRYVDFQNGGGDSGASFALAAQVVDVARRRVPERARRRGAAQLTLQ